MTQLLDAHDAVSIEQSTFATTTGHTASICPLCDSHSSVQFEKHEIPIRECNACRHRFAIPEESPADHIEHVYGDDYFFNGGAGYDDY
jgi:Zn ribbon nucleic-acid-binding protein